MPPTAALCRPLPPARGATAPSPRPPPPPRRPPLRPPHPFTTAVAASSLRAAHAHSVEMASKNYFSHNSFDGTSWLTRLRANGYTGGNAAENIAAGYSTVLATATGWMWCVGWWAHPPSLGWRAGSWHCGSTLQRVRGARRLRGPGRRQPSPPTPPPTPTPPHTPPHTTTPCLTPQPIPHPAPHPTHHPTPLPQLVGAPRQHPVMHGRCDRIGVRLQLGLELQILLGTGGEVGWGVWWVGGRGRGAGRGGPCAHRSPPSTRIWPRPSPWPSPVVCRPTTLGAFPALASHAEATRPSPPTTGGRRAGTACARPLAHAGLRPPPPPPLPSHTPACARLHLPGGPPVGGVHALFCPPPA